MIKQVRRKLPAHASAAIDIDDEEEDDEEDEDGGYVYQYRLGKIPPKSFDPKRLITEDDKVTKFAQFIASILSKNVIL